MWLGIIGDTRGGLDLRAITALKGLDYILHYGGVGEASVIAQLSTIAPIAGVTGKGDDPTVIPFETTLRRRFGGHVIFVCHRIGDPLNLTATAATAIASADPHVVIFGNRGVPFHGTVGSRLFFSPGAAGLRTRTADRSVGVIEVDTHGVRAEVVRLERA